MSLRTRCLTTDWSTRGMRIVPALCAAAVLVGPLGRLPRLRADEIVHGSTTLQRVKIVDLDGARIAYRTPGGEMRFIHLAEVDQLIVESVGTLRDLNDAESLRARGQPDRAITFYERAIPHAPRFWQRLVRARLIQTCDEADRIETLATHLTTLVSRQDQGTFLAATLLPRKAPTADGEGARNALRRINGMIDQVASQSARVVLETLRFSIVERTGGRRIDEYAAELSRQPIPLVVATRRVYQARARALERWQVTGHAAEALQQIHSDLKNAPQAVLPELLLAKARILAGRATDRESWIRTGWVAMRVVIHYPQDERTPEALLLAADVHERIGRIPTAVQLLNECAAHDRCTVRLRKRAQSEIERLTASG